MSRSNTAAKADDNQDVAAALQAAIARAEQAEAALAHVRSEADRFVDAIEEALDGSLG